MTTTKRDLQALAYLVKRLREETAGAREWQDAGLWSVLTKLEGHNLAMTIERVTRHAADAEAKTPGAIRRPFIPDAAKPGTWRPLKPDEACRNCGLAKHPANSDCDGRPAPKTADVSAPVAHLRALRDETTAELCSHGVKRTNCLDHTTCRETEPETDQPKEGASND